MVVINDVLIVAPSLDAAKNVSGVSAVANFIIANNKECRYTHFLQGKGDNEHGGLSRALRLIANYRKWKKLLGTLPTDQIIHYNFPLDALSVIRDYFFMNAARKKQKRLVVHLHGGLYLFSDHKPFLIRYLLKRIFGWNNPFIVLSNKEKEQVENTYQAKKVYVLPNCVDLSVASSFHREFSSEKLQLLFLGRIEPNKGLDDLYEAMKTLQLENLDFVLHFAGKEQGSNHYIEKFSQLLGDKFVYEGVVSGLQKDELMKQCDLFLLPSYYEGLPMSLLECMSFGMIPITTNVGSISDFVEQGKTGLFVKKKDPASLVEAILHLSDDHALRRSLSEGARDKIFSTLNSEDYIANLCNIYQYA